jgi:SAM-dependent methyltransferase
MNDSETGSSAADNPESRRIGRTYEGYLRSRRKQRAWDAANPGNVAIRAELRERALQLAAAPLGRHGRILDIGCGTGRWLGELVHAGVDPARLHGVDLLADRVAAAVASVPGAEIRQGDALRLPYPSGHFELVTMFTLLSSLPSRELVHAALVEADRVLAGGGLLLCYEPRVWSPLNPATRRISLSELRLRPNQEIQVVPVTVLPPLVRRLGPLTKRMYPILRSVPLLLTHRLVAQPTSPAQRLGP